MSFHKRTNKQTVIHPNNGILFGAKKNELSTHDKHRGILNHQMKEANQEGLYTVFPLTDVLEKTKKAMDTRQRPVVPRGFQGCPGEG